MTSNQTGNVINLAGFQQQMDEIIFDYIDSKPNWDKAFTLLDEMLEQTTKYFVEYVERKGELPTATTYWVLFTELNAKLLYFTTLALHHRTQNSSGITNEILAQRYETAAKCLINIYTEENELFIDEIKQSFLEVSSGLEFNGAKDREAKECIQLLYEFAQTY